MAAAVLVLASAGIAHATRNPNPPPSGIVVHLFGPNGILSDVTPHLPGETPSPSAHAQTGATPPSGTDGANSIATSDDPSWGSILHQMFVVGDPNHPNQPASGRPGERQPVPTSH